MLRDIFGSLRGVFGIAARLYGLDGPGFESRHGQEICFFSKTSSPALCFTQPAIQYLEGFFRGVKRPVRDVVDPRSSTAKVKNE
jgi:hypothetical protein